MKDEARSGDLPYSCMVLCLSNQTLLPHTPRADPPNRSLIHRYRWPGRLNYMHPQLLFQLPFQFSRHSPH
jgi:hypothetical protein